MRCQARPRVYSHGEHSRHLLPSVRAATAKELVVDATSRDRLRHDVLQPKFGQVSGPTPDAAARHRGWTSTCIPQLLMQIWQYTHG